MRGSVDAGDIAVWVLGGASLVLLATSLVLGVTGASGEEWTGAIGGILLMMWAQAYLGNRKSRRRRDR